MPSWASSIEVHMGGKRQDMDNMRSSVSMRVRVCACVCVCACASACAGGGGQRKRAKYFVHPVLPYLCVGLLQYLSQYLSLYLQK